MAVLSVRTIAAFLGSTIGFALPAAMKLTGGDLFVRYLLLCEDGVYESLGALFLLAASLLFASAGSRLRTLHNNERRLPLGPWACALILLLAFLEEISWGQRLLQVDTPDAWLQWTQGAELNLHNLPIFYGRDAHVSFAQWGFVLGSLLLFLIVPLLSRRSDRLARWTDRFSFPVAGGGLVLAFVWTLTLAVAYVLAFAANNELADGQQATEVFELVVEMLLVFLALESRSAAFAAANEPIAARPRLGAWALLLLLTAGAAQVWTFSRTVLPPYRAIGLLLEGNDRMENKDYIRALRSFERATQLNPKSAGAWYSRAVAEEKLGAVDTAAASYQRAVHLMPAFAEAHNNLGVLLFKKGRPREAAVEFEAALAADPNHPQAKENLRSAQRMLGRP
jgi:tetratricopeptide (TPR) repeat protein